MKRKHLKKVVALVMNSVWAITAERFEQIRDIVALRGQGVRLSPDEIQARIAVGRPFSPAPAMTGQTQAGKRIAMLNLSGLISPRVNAMTEISGGTSTEMFGKAFDQAVADDSVSAIVFNVDSGGGHVAGVPELADKIFAARGKKPIFAVANFEMGSAAYWIASQADQIVAAPSANVGSIGVVAIHTDESQADAEAGLKRTVLTTSKYKAEGNSHEPLSDAAKTAIQARLQSYHDMFVGGIAKARGISLSKVEADYGQGRMLIAADALKAGLVDRIGTLDSVLAELGATPAPSLAASSQSPAIAACHVERVEKVEESKRTPPEDSSTPSTLLTLSTAKDCSMDPKILTAMIRAGLCDASVTKDNAEAILKGYFAAKNVALPTDPAAVAAALAVPASAGPALPATIDPPPPKGGTTSGMPIEDMIAAINLAPLAADRKLALQAELVKERATLSTSQVLDRINKASVEANKPTGAAVVVTADSTDKFRVAARDAILVRTFGGDLPKEIYDMRAGDMTEWKPVARKNYGLMSLSRMAEACLIQGGIPANIVASLAPYQIARAVLGTPLSEFGIMADGAGGPLFNVSGMFTNILLDAQNVLLRKSYTEAKTTFQVWMRQAESIPDFKPVNKVIAGELSDPKAVPEDGEFEEVTLTDGKELYKLVVWGEVFSISWQAIVNDRLNSFTEIPMKQGTAMRRKQNKLAYGVINDNGLLGQDGIALFDTATHKNLTTGVNPPNVANLNTLYTNMAQQTGLSSGTPLNLEPKFIWGPPALRGTILQLLGSTADPASSNANVKNIWENALQPVIDAQLGASVTGGSDVRWGVAADNADVDTIEYAYLQGLETPVMEQQVAFDRLGVRHRVYQAFAVKAIDFRGLQQQVGA